MHPNCLTGARGGSHLLFLYRLNTALRVDRLGASRRHRWISGRRGEEGKAKQSSPLHIHYSPALAKETRLTYPMAICAPPTPLVLALGLFISRKDLICSRVGG